MNFIQISNNRTISSTLFTEIHERLSKRSLNIHMSRVNFDKQYRIDIFILSSVSQINHASRNPVIEGSQKLAQLQRLSRIL